MSGRKILETLEERGMLGGNDNEDETLDFMHENHLYVAADIGNALTKLAIEPVNPTGRPRQLIWSQPTAKANFGLELPDQLQPGEMVIQRQRQTLPTAVGDAALRYSSQPVTARLSPDRYGPFQLDFLFAGLAALFRRDKNMTVELALLVPSNVAERVAPVVAATFTGNHIYTAQDVGEYRLQLRGKPRVYREGVCAAYGCLPDGHKGRAIIVDVGGGTTHIALAEDGRVLRSVTRASGFQLVLDAAEKQLARNLNRNLTMRERFDLERAIQRDVAYSVQEGGKVEITGAARTTVQEVGIQIAYDIKTIVPAHRSADVYLVGGGAHFFASLFTEEFGEVNLIKQPEYANVRGAMKMLREKQQGVKIG
jgi:pantothenate kinase type III